MSCKALWRHSINYIRVTRMQYANWIHIIAISIHIDCCCFFLFSSLSPLLCIWSREWSIQFQNVYGSFFWLRYLYAVILIIYFDYKREKKCCAKFFFFKSHRSFRKGRHFLWSRTLYFVKLNEQKSQFFHLAHLQSHANCQCLSLSLYLSFVLFILVVFCNVQCWWSLFSFWFWFLGHWV